MRCAHYKCLPPNLAHNAAINAVHIKLMLASSCCAFEKYCHQCCAYIKCLPAHVAHLLLMIVVTFPYSHLQKYCLHIGNYLYIHVCIIVSYAKQVMQVS